MGYADDVIGRARVHGDETWDPPLPLTRAKRIPVFPAHRFPPWLDQYCCAIAHALQVPVDLPAMLGLSVLGTAAGGRCVIEVRPGWREPLNLFTTTAMPPGARKTPVFQRMIRPLLTAEQAAVEGIRGDIAEARVRLSAANAIADKAEGDVARASDAAKEEAVNYAKQTRLMAEACTVPVVPRLLADDATPEALTSLLAEQNGRLALFSDEGEVFNMIAGRYSTSGPNLGVYLKGHVGSPIRVDRKGRDAEFIESPALTLGLTIQPDMLAAISTIQGARGRGLLGRFLWSVPPSNVGRRETAATPVPEAVEALYIANVTALVSSLTEWTDPAVLVCTADADAAVAAFERALEPRLDLNTGDLGHIADWAAKLAGHVVRIAGLLHLAANIRTGWAEPVEAATVADAIAIADCLIVHALVAFEVMEADPLLADALAVLDWIARRRQFSRRDIYKAYQYRFGVVANVDPVLELLVEHEYIRKMASEKTTGRGRPPGPKYIVNPQLGG